MLLADFKEKPNKPIGKGKRGNWQSASDNYPSESYSKRDKTGEVNLYDPAGYGQHSYG